MPTGARRRAVVGGLGLHFALHLCNFHAGALKLNARKTVVLGRPVAYQRIPALGNPRALQHQVRHAQAAQVFAPSNARLASAHEQRSYEFVRHGLHPWRVMRPPNNGGDFYQLRLKGNAMRSGGRRGAQILGLWVGKVGCVAAAGVVKGGGLVYKDAVAETYLFLPWWCG